MTLAHQLVTKSHDELLEICKQLETCLLTGGVTPGHEWMFDLREILYDFRRMEELASTLAESTDGEDAAAILMKFARTGLYETLPHLQGHFSHLEQQLENKAKTEEPE